MMIKSEVTERSQVKRFREILFEKVTTEQKV